MHNDHGWLLKDVTKIHPDCELDDAEKPIVLNLSDEQLKEFRETINKPGELVVVKGALKNEPGELVAFKNPPGEEYAIKEVDLEATTQKAKDDCMKIVGKDLEKIIKQKSKDETEKRNNGRHCQTI
jgi:hypothetical protein